MTKSVQKNNCTIYNPSVVLYDVLHSLGSSRIEKCDDFYQYFGKIQAGDYTLKTDKDGNIVSLVVKNAQISFEFE